MLFVSHDRQFLGALSNRVLEVTPTACAPTAAATRSTCAESAPRGARGALTALGGGAGATEGDELGVGGWFIRARFSSALARAVCVSSDGSIYIVDTESGRVIERHSARRASDEEMYPDAPLFSRMREGSITQRDGGAWKDNSDDADAPLSPDGRAYVCVREGALCAVDLETQRVLVVLSKQPARVHDVRWDRSGERVAIAHKRAIEVFNVRAATRVARIEIDTRPAAARAEHGPSGVRWFCVRVFKRRDALRGRGQARRGSLLRRGLQGGRDGEGRAQGRPLSTGPTTTRCSSCGAKG
jgi:hypothetical protein